MSFNTNLQDLHRSGNASHLKLTAFFGERHKWFLVGTYHFFDCYDVKNAIPVVAIFCRQALLFCLSFFACISEEFLGQSIFLYVAALCECWSALLNYLPRRHVEKFLKGIGVSSHALTYFCVCCHFCPFLHNKLERACGVNGTIDAFACGDLSMPFQWRSKDPT